MSIRWVRQTLTAVLLVTAGALFLNEIFPVSGRSAPQERAVAVPPPAPTFAIARAAKPIARGSIIRDEDIRLEETSKAPAAGTLASVLEAKDRITLRNIGASEALTQNNTAATQEGTRLSEVIPQGLRAVSLRVSDDSSMVNLIRPGDRVDVLVISNLRIPPAAGRVFPPAEVRTVLQNVPVLAVGNATVAGGANNPNGPARTVALAVTPQQAAMVGLIRVVGVEYLSLRPADDGAETAMPSVSTNDLQPNQSAPQRPVAAASAPAQVRPRTRTIEVIAGRSDNVSRVTLAERQ
jgi:pilus assembly protein CpaB